MHKRHSRSGDRLKCVWGINLNLAVLPLTPTLLWNSFSFSLCSPYSSQGDKISTKIRGGMAARQPPKVLKTLKTIERCSPINNCLCRLDISLNLDTKEEMECSEKAL